MDAQEILDEIDRQEDYFHKVKAAFPYMSRPRLGQTTFRTAPYYRAKGYDRTITLPKPLDEADLQDIRDVTHWLNQSYVVRLHAILDAYRVIPKKDEGVLDQSLDGWRDVDFARRLRNKIAHTSGRYDPTSRRQRRLYRDVNRYYRVKQAPPAEAATEFLIPIDLVLVPMTNGCRRYVLSLSERLVEGTRA